MDDLITLFTDYEAVASEGQALQLWERQSREPEQSYLLFATYFLPLGATRTLKLAWRRFYEEHGEMYPHGSPNVVPSIWRNFYDAFQWGQRAIAYDNEQLRLRNLLWLERQETVRDDEWALYESLKTALQKGLKVYHRYLDSLDDVPEPGKQPRRPAVTTLDIERLAMQVTTYGRNPTGLPVNGLGMLITAQASNDSMEDIRRKRWELMQGRFEQGDRGLLPIIEGEVLND